MDGIAVSYLDESNDASEEEPEVMLWCERTFGSPDAVYYPLDFELKRCRYGEGILHVKTYYRM